MKHICIFLCCVLLTTSKCFAVELINEQAAITQTEALEDALPDDAAEILDDMEPAKAVDFSEVFDRLLKSVIKAWDSWMPAAAKTTGTLIVAVLLCSLIKSVGIGNDTALTAAGTLALIGICTEGIQSVFSVGTQTLNNLEAFSDILLISLSAATASAGATATAAAMYAGTAFFFNILLRLSTALLLPMIYGFLAMGTAAAALKNEMLQRISGLLKWMVTFCLKVLSTVFIAYMTISGVISGSADGTTVKAVKLAISTAVPVVGSIISDATETMLVSAGILKNTVGVFGLLGALAICVVPFVRIGLQYLGLKVAAALSGAIDTVGLVKLLDTLAAAMGMVLAMTAVALFITMFGCICTLRVAAV